MRLALTAATVLLGLSQSIVAQAAGAVPLVEAVKRGDRAEVQRLLKSGVSVNDRTRDGATALHWAAHRDELEMVDLLIRAGASVKVTDSHGVTPVGLASENGNAQIIARLLDSGADPNTALPDGETVLMTAARTGHLEAVNVLLARRANVNATERTRGQTALMWASAQKHPSVVRALLEHGADPRARSNGGLTPLMFAVRVGDIESTEALLAGGADLKETASDGTGVLGLAIINAHFQLAATLLDHGVDPNAQDPRGSALHAVAFVRRTRFGTLATVLPRVPTGTLDSLDLVKALVAHGADPNVRFGAESAQRLKETGADDLKARRRAANQDARFGATVVKDVALGGNELNFSGATPFWIAARNADVALMRVLVSLGANPLIPSYQNVTPLMVAAGFGMWPGETPGTDEEAFEAVRLARELGNDVHAVADYGDMIGGDPRQDGGNAMHGAAIRGANAIVQWLVDKGVRPDARTKAGWTPLTITRGVYIGGTVKTRPATEALLVRLLKARGLSTDDPADPLDPVKRLQAEEETRNGGRR